MRAHLSPLRSSAAASANAPALASISRAAHRPHAFSSAATAARAHSMSLFVMSMPKIFGRASLTTPHNKVSEG